MPSKKPTHLYVPSTFDPQKHLPENLRKHADSARYFLHRIIWGDIQKQRTLDEFVPLKFAYLREIIPDRFIRPVKLALLDSGVIETDNQYIEGSKALGYRLAPEHRGPIIRVALADPQTATKIENSRKAAEKKITLDVHRHLRKQFKRLDVNVSGALNALSGRPDFETGRLLIELISRKEGQFSVCRYGRVHSVLTRCPSIVRSFLSVDGEPLIEMDVANSQPLLLCLTIKLFRETGKKAFARVSFEPKEKDPYRDMDTIIENTVFPFPQKEQEILPPPSTSSITNRKAIERLTEYYTDQEFAATERKPGGRKCPSFGQHVPPCRGEAVGVSRRGAGSFSRLLSINGCIQCYAGALI